MKLSNKREVQQIVINISPDTDFKDFMKIHKKSIANRYCFLVDDDTFLESNDHLHFRYNILEKN